MAPQSTAAVPYEGNRFSAEVARIIDATPMIPVLTFKDEEEAVAVSRALVAGGIKVLEVTLRTEAGLRSIAAIAEAVPGAIVGAGTLLAPSHFGAALEAGAHFAVSPGHTPRLLDAAEESGLPYLPAAGSPSEVMGLLERGYTRQKLFPAEPLGGIPLLKGMADPIPYVRFCPTGGIDIQKAPAYLALANVACVGGSWVVPKDAIVARDMGRIEKLAREAAALRPAA